MSNTTIHYETIADAHDDWLETISYEEMVLAVIDDELEAQAAERWEMD